VGEDETADLDVSPPPLLAPTLNPQSKPHSMGISFILQREDGVPEFEVCVTWARYRKHTYGWKREPRCFISGIKLQGDEVVLRVDGNGNETRDMRQTEISLHFVSRIVGNSSYRIGAFLVNRIQQPPEGQPLTAEYHIFQPQIRIRCVGGTKIVPGLQGFPDNDEERELSFLYRNRPVLARGHLCSAVWKEIDPERESFSDTGLDFPRCRNEPPFRWVDGELLPDHVRRRFSPPDVRTDFVPLYPIHSPRLSWQSEHGNEPELRTEVLAEAWDPADLRRSLEPIADGYRRWIDDLRSQSAVFLANEHKIAERLIKRCEEIAARMQKGIDLLLTNDNARLAFCFANKVMEIQSLWSRGQPLKWHPFQLAFILLTLHSVMDPQSPDRLVCDLLWVPTGTGKTEAYLAVAAFTIAYRRRQALTGMSGNRSGAGVSVISRYTLRLLSIQQFRRALRMVTACEYLRVFGLGDSTSVGWRPSGCSIQGNFIWGSSRFSIGLWVGGGVTPNRLRDTWGGNQMVPGALRILREGQGEGEPAQVLNCPSCDAILSVPEMGIRSGTHALHLVVHSDMNLQTLEHHVALLSNLSLNGVAVNGASVRPHQQNNYFTLTLNLLCTQNATADDIDQLWTLIQNTVRNLDLASARASRPGYFIRSYRGRRGQPQDYDFDILCPNPECPLHRPWSEGTPAGYICGSSPHAMGPVGGVTGLLSWSDGNRPAHVIQPFRAGTPYVSDRIPIPAYTVDDQIYHRCPSVVVATVDKFARLAFEPRASALFGNVEYHHCVWGFYRRYQHPADGDVNGHPVPAGTENSRNYVGVQRLRPPDLIIQDELHLIEGPLGSLVGIYEAATDFLCSETGQSLVKYIASTATVRRAKEQVQAVFCRSVRTFPPPGLLADDRFFIRFNEGHPLEDAAAGRLYVGICSPGRGPLTPAVRIWSRLLHTAGEHHGHPAIDCFWTLTGYFNAIRELAGARALYRQDIPERLQNQIGSARVISEDRCQELSSRTDSTDLPALLDLLNQHCPDAQDALFTTSMFGTGVDIPRIGLMVVHGQPKTSSAYIQSTGRVGRSRGALVVVFLRATRPRDLNHYEFFCGYHRQLDRFVEPITVYPFAPGVLDRACGPVGVLVLRNMENVTIPWHRDDSAPEMATQRTGAPEVLAISAMLENRGQRQPHVRRPASTTVQRFADSELDHWQQVAALTGRNLKYVEYAIAQSPVVLGDPPHVHMRLDVVYENAPQSLRDIEETTGFET